jgi:hypothetical protein
VSLHILDLPGFEDWCRSVEQDLPAWPRTPVGRRPQRPHAELGHEMPLFKATDRAADIAAVSAASESEWSGSRAWGPG